MKVYFENIKISTLDIKAIENDLLVPFDHWLEDAFRGMINKAVNSIKSSYELKLSEDKEINQIPTSDKELIELIISRPYFLKLKIPSADLSLVKRSEDPTIPVLSNGIEIQDYEELALANCFDDYKERLHSLADNKIFNCRVRLLDQWKEIIADRVGPSNIPGTQDGYLALIFSQSDYKNRSQRDAQQ